MKRALALGLTLSAVAFAAGCSTGAETATSAANSSKAATGTIEISYLQKQGDQQYFVDQANGAKAMAKELGGVNVTVVNLGTDSNKAISEVDAAIARKAQGIIIVVPDQAIGPQVADKAKAANVPLMASDDIIKDSSGAEVPFAGFDGTAMGTEVGKKAAELYKASGWTAADTKIMSVTKLDLSVCMQRVDGALAAFKAAVPDAPAMVQVGSDASVTGSLDKAAATITANQGVKNWIVWGCNDESVTGAVTAVQNANIKPANIIGVGLGAYLACKDWKAGQTTGMKAALYISGVEVGRAAVKSMVDKIRNNVPLPAKSIAKTTMVDATTWQSAGVTCT
ncbi:MAG TPA: sugar ABC transporter substrate-binding protein [Propionibacteriaceae bacterium]|nr:substrate-binding domain-containing protein [Micropruina sp.]HBX80266.1 sugar ABC transporter substrate-binding protein [Propionibacteriaceae bacterium]HBY23826.1 sugar ABC transporter substrate-binding protein [Propionibacteriaceae bacterium]